MPKPMKRLATPEITSSLVNSLVNLVDVTWHERGKKKQAYSIFLYNLIDKEPRSEEESDAHKDEGEMRKNSWVDWGDIAGQSVERSHSHLASLQVWTIH